MLLNCPEFFEVLLACNRLGAIFVPLNFRLAAPEVGFIIEDSAPTVFIYHGDFAHIAGTVRPAGYARHLVQLGGDVPAGVLTYDVLNEDASVSDVAAEVAADDAAFMIYTSGTTGRPKGALLSHGNLLWNAVQILMRIPGREDDVNYQVAPLFHVAGLNGLATPLLFKGATTLLYDKFDPREALAMMSRYKATCSVMVPAMWGAIMRLPDFDEYDLRSLRYCLAGGAPCPMPVIEFYQGRGIAFLDCYGLTETSPIVCLNSAEAEGRRAGSVGRPGDQVEVRIVDDEDRDVSRNAVGELLVRAPNVMLGYWNRPDATAETMRGGWFHTGDLARQDGDGFVYVVDRKKDLIISGGENVYPIEVEQVLSGHPMVSDVAVVGTPDEQWGEAVTAVVVPKEGMEVTLEEIRDFCEGRLASYKRPRRLRTLSALPRNPTGKVLKNKLRETFSADRSVSERG